MNEYIEKEERDAGLINLILEYATKNSMSFKEVETCIDKVKDVYLSDGLIKRY